MAPLVLYTHPASPPACAVRILAAKLNLELELRIVDLAGLEHKSDAIVKLNPMGTIPILLDGDVVVSESHAIMKYLLGKYGSDEHKSLYPSDLVSRSLIDTCMFFDTGVFFIRLKVVILPMLLEGSPGPTARQLADIEGAFAIVEDYLSRNRFIAGDTITLADLSVACTATTIQSIHKLDPFKFPLVAAWISRLQEEPWFKKTNTDCVATITKVYDTFSVKNKK